jgi:hypothetical protein
MMIAQEPCVGMAHDYRGAATLRACVMILRKRFAWKQMRIDPRCIVVSAGNEIPQRVTAGNLRTELARRGNLRVPRVNSAFTDAKV